ncbi:hypothetical protein [Pediococcus ethanolidurans]|uniref:hypothetical protein n=1 Tax=Pediococcus ethanolidurans TaxID=319653 RepID=UPI00345E48D0
MFGSLLQLLGLSRWYHHEQHADRLNARKASGKSVFSYDDLKGLRKLAFWLFVFSIFLNWGHVRCYYANCMASNVGNKYNLLVSL